MSGYYSDSDDAYDDYWCDEDYQCDDGTESVCYDDICHCDDNLSFEWSENHARDNESCIEDKSLIFDFSYDFDDDYGRDGCSSLCEGSEFEYNGNWFDNLGDDSESECSNENEFQRENYCIHQNSCDSAGELNEAELVLWMKSVLEYYNDELHYCVLHGDEQYIDDSQLPQFTQHRPYGWATWRLYSAFIAFIYPNKNFSCCWIRCR